MPRQPQDPSPTRRGKEEYWRPAPASVESRHNQEGRGATVLPTELRKGTRGRAASLGQPVPPSRMSRAALLKRRIRLHGTILVSARQPERFGVHPGTQPFLSAPSQPAPESDPLRLRRAVRVMVASLVGSSCNLGHHLWDLHVPVRHLLCIPEQSQSWSPSISLCCGSSACWTRPGLELGLGLSVRHLLFESSPGTDALF